MTSPSHVPNGDPCLQCGKLAITHRVEHVPQGNPCQVCGLPFNNHKPRSRNAAQTQKRKAYQNARPNNRYYSIGLDGEGQGREDHKYVFLAAGDATGRHKWSVENLNGLSTVQCLDFILNLPGRWTQFFSYAFNYDITKILTDVDNKTLYYLMRPEYRQRKGLEARKGPYPVKWNGYLLNLQGTKFTIKRGKRRVIVWDIFKFFGCKFTQALEDWRVGINDKMLLAQLDDVVANGIREWMGDQGLVAVPMVKFLEYMKDNRAHFDKLPKADTEAYCYVECRYIAELGDKLTKAHEDIGLELRTYYGAGSSAAAMLKKMGIQDKLAPVIPEMEVPVASSFFGGRFENSVIGTIPEGVYNYDISSAYPYQLCFLPCLLHGRWEHTKSRRDLVTAQNGVVRYRLPFSRDVSGLPWGPFPFRAEDGSICFPHTSGGGWVWREEFLAGEEAFPNVCFESAWVYHSDCDCRPFADIPGYYLERLRIGKEGPGIVLKLGCNSCYGKLAQSVGLAPYHSWIWASLITSGTRAQILQLMGMLKDYSDLLMVATDGVFLRRPINTPIPRDTGTSGGYSVKKGFEHYRYEEVPQEGRDYKPLGGWEKKELPNGVFVCRPGIYFPLSPTAKQLKDIKGRGVGKKVILENWRTILEAWEAGPSEDTVVRVTNVSRFCGAKSCISVQQKDSELIYNRATRQTARDEHAPAYGQWITRPVDLSFHPKPKRERVNPDGRTLKVRQLSEDVVSHPYKRAIQMLSEDAIQLKAAEQEAREQPNGFAMEDYNSEMDMVSHHD